MTPLMALREALEIPRKQVAAGLEIEYSHLYRIEMGTAQCSAPVAEKISNYYEGAVTRDQILFPHLYEEKKTKKPVRRASSESVAAHG